MPANFWNSAAYSLRGGRENNEDNYYLDGAFLPEGGVDESPRALGLRPKGVLAVFDGMGGEQAGEYASFTAAKLLDGHRAALMSCRDLEDFRPAVQAYIRAVNEALLRRGKELGATVGAAMALLLFRGQEALIASLGDCRIYRLRAGKPELLTRDHTLAAFLVRRGDLSPEQARTDKRRHALMRHLGSDQGGEALLPGYKRLELEAGDRFLLCSDGIYDGLPEAEMGSLLGRGKPAAAAKALAEAAARAGSRDNLTALTAQVQMRLF